ncbi:MAG: orotate phosphoribosyltransferase [Kiritimatiellae bacterium]|nr:orotate phosphoribosyltransferase [Kiritimatiellia bacterium]
MSEKQVLKAFKDTGALLEGHFELRSKLHSDRYFQCANVLRYPRIAEKLCREVTRRAVKSGKLGRRIDGVISPAVGGILVGHEVARELGVKCVFAEKVPGAGVDATGKPNTVLAMRRFALRKGERYVVAEDVVTKGGRVQETIDLVKAAGARVAGVVVLVDRSAGRVKFGRTPLFSLVRMTPATWTAAECPMCRAGGKPVHPGS